jgi:two-component system nitrogen regulation sensor histidine kinase NtrY
MVDEFSRFARMPAPSFASHDIIKLVRDVVFSRESSDLPVMYDVRIPQQEGLVYCDAGQITQVMTNLCKNAEEALEEKIQKNAGYKGRITVELLIKDHTCCIDIYDNGDGFPDNMLDHLTEPYVTTKSKGTGLGLAIVKKIIEDHKGIIEFSNTEEGAHVGIELPLEISKGNQ